MKSLEHEYKVITIKVAIKLYMNPDPMMRSVREKLLTRKLSRMSQSTLSTLSYVPTGWMCVLLTTENREYYW